MANLVIFVKGTKEIKFIIKDCIQDGNNFEGSNFNIYGIKLNLFDYIWTNDEVNKIFDGDGKLIGFDRDITQIKPAPLTENTRRIRPNREEYKSALKIREQISSFDFDQIDSYVDSTITDLESAKKVLKMFGKSILALCKEIDYKSK